MPCVCGGHVASVPGMPDSSCSKGLLMTGYCPCSIRPHQAARTSPSLHLLLIVGRCSSHRRGGPGSCPGGALAGCLANVYAETATFIKHEGTPVGYEAPRPEP